MQALRVRIAELIEGLGFPDFNDRELANFFIREKRERHAGYAVLN